MRTNGDFVSRVVGDLKAITKDGRISKRLVLSTGRDKARFLLTQKLDEMTLFREEGIITPIDCFEMKSIDTRICSIFEFKTCDNLMRSKNRLPAGLFGKNGSGIISVSSVDGKSYEYIQPSNFKRLKKRKYIKRDKAYFYTENGYLFLPNSTNELVDIRMITLDKTEAQQLSSCNNSASEHCPNVWDSEFICPDRFYDLVVKDTLNELASIWRSSVKDENPDLNENSKTKDVQ